MHNLQEEVYAWLVASKLTAMKAPEWRQLCKEHSVHLSSIMTCSLPQWLDYGLPQKLFEAKNTALVLCEKALLEATAKGLQCITYDDMHYPSQLKHLSRPPCVLFVLGNAAKLNAQQVAIVGSRHATKNGLLTARNLAQELSFNNVVVTSGLARGIDAAAHEGALAHGNTVAVLGTGADICYPKYHTKLYDRILNTDGAIVSEFFPGTSPRAHHFPCRNRIVAGLSLGVLVIEAKIRSGSLITANLAADMGKDVFAVPGNISNPLSEGVNWLIQQGAKLVTQTSDILEEIGVEGRSFTASKKTEQKALATDPLLDSVDYDVTSIDDITKRSKLPIQDLMAALLEYELRGIVAAVPGGYIKLRGK